MDNISVLDEGAMDREVDSHCRFRLVEVYMGDIPFRAKVKVMAFYDFEFLCGNGDVDKSD